MIIDIYNTKKPGNIRDAYLYYCMNFLPNCRDFVKFQNLIISEKCQAPDVLIASTWIMLLKGKRSSKCWWSLILVSTRATSGGLCQSIKALKLHLNSSQLQPTVSNYDIHGSVQSRGQSIAPVPSQSWVYYRNKVPYNSVVRCSYIQRAF